MIPFADWKPDQADLAGGATANASGVLPIPGGFGPWKAFNVYSGALAAAPLRAVLTYKKDGTRNIWTGTTTKLYKLNRSTLAFDDVSRTVGGNYACAAAEGWGFVQFGTTLIAHNVNDTTQSIDVESGTNFAALAGSPPSARYGAVVKDFVVLGNIASNPNRIHNSAINDCTGWTVGTNQSDTQDFPDGGDVMGIVGGEVGLIFQKEAIRRMTYVGPPTYFQIDKIEDKRGLRAPFSVVRVGGIAFYLSQEGFASITLGGDSALIDTGAISGWFLDDVDASFIDRIRAVGDPVRTRVYWMYRSNSASSNYDTILCFDYTLNRWTYKRGNFSEIVQAVTSGYTLEGLDTLGTLDALALSLDDLSLKGDFPALAAFNTSFKLGFFSGANEEAVIETAEIEPFPGRRAFCSGFRPVIDADTMYGSVGSRTKPSDGVTYSPERTPESSTGICSQRIDGRYLRFKTRIPAGAVWSKAQGIDPMIVATGQR
jgi:hypothetical protein